MEECKEAAEEQVVCDGCGGVVLPDAGALDHVAFLHFRLSGSSVLFGLGLFSASSSKLSLEVVLDLLLAGLLLFLERGEIVLTSIIITFLLLLGRLLLLLQTRQQKSLEYFHSMQTHLLREVGEHVGHLIDLLVRGACNPTCQLQLLAMAERHLTK